MTVSGFGLGFVYLIFVMLLNSTLTMSPLDAQYIDVSRLYCTTFTSHRNQPGTKRMMADVKPSA